VVIAAADRIAGGVAGGPGVPPGALVEAVLLIGVGVEVVDAVGQVRRAVRGALRRAGGDAHPGAAGAGVRAMDRRVVHAGDRHVIQAAPEGVAVGLVERAFGPLVALVHARLGVVVLR